jgi:S1-C subfamily serine protease
LILRGTTVKQLIVSLAREGRLSDQVESVMAEWAVASKLTIRRNSCFALFFGGIGFATGSLIASPNLLQVQLFPKKELPHVVAIERAPRFASFAELAHAVKPAVIAVLARTAEADLASGADGPPEGQRSRFSTSQGSGFFITADGYAVTCNHVIEGSA